MLNPLFSFAFLSFLVTVAQTAPQQNLSFTTLVSDPAGASTERET